MLAVYLGLGTNRAREASLRGALEALQDRFGPLRCSPIYESAATGGLAPHYLNAVVELHTDVGVERLVEILKSTERRLGRGGEAEAAGEVTIDIDLLLYGELVLAVGSNRVPSADILELAHVLRPLADLVPSARHPEVGLTYRQLWDRMAVQAPDLVPYVMPPADDESNCPT